MVPSSKMQNTLCTLPPASPEQAQVIQDIDEGLNVIVDAVAGSGKTTNIFHIGLKNQEKQLLVLTYNKALKFEGRMRAESLGIGNIEIHTYHSAAGTYYDTPGSTMGNMVTNIITRDQPPRRDLDHDVLVLDEVQDMTRELYLLTCKMLHDFRKPPQLLILGDKYQCLYRFRGADPRFIINAHELYPTYLFKHRCLSTSYRITRPMADFVNYMIGFHRINAIKDGSNVHYYSSNPYNKFVTTELYDWLRCKFQAGYQPEDVFILAYSVKRNNVDKPVHALENILSRNKINIYRPLDDMVELDDKATRGKVIISSFHQAKGRERKICICYGFDKDYFKFSNQSRDVDNGLINPYLCPNEWYVGATRGIDHLVIVGNKAYPPWITGHPPNAVRLHGNLPDLSIYCKSRSKNKTTPTDLVKHLSNDTVQELQRLLDGLLIKSPVSGINVDINTVISGDTVEEVSDITGIGITALYEHFITGSVSSIYECLETVGRLTFSIDPDSESPSDYLILANHYESYQSGYINRVMQIKNYDWLDQEQVDGCFDNIELHISAEDIRGFEIEVVTDYQTQFGEVTVKGRIDCIASDTVWEFKCVRELTLEHFLQLVVYSWMCYRLKMKQRSVGILNIRTGKCYMLSKNPELVTKIMDKLFEAKFKPGHVSTREEFLLSCQQLDPAKGDELDECML